MIEDGEECEVVKSLTKQASARERERERKKMVMKLERNPRNLLRVIGDLVFGKVGIFSQTERQVHVSVMWN